MARKLNKKDIKERLKLNKSLMTDSKKEVAEMISTTCKGQFINAVEVRRSLAVFIKSSNAVISDNAKLKSIEGT